MLHVCEVPLASDAFSAVGAGFGLRGHVERLGEQLRWRADPGRRPCCRREGRSCCPFEGERPATPQPCGLYQAIIMS